MSSKSYVVFCYSVEQDLTLSMSFFFLREREGLQDGREELGNGDKNSQDGYTKLHPVFIELLEKLQFVTPKLI